MFRFEKNAANVCLVELCLRVFCSVFCRCLHSERKSISENHKLSRQESENDYKFKLGFDKYFEIAKPDGDDQDFFTQS